MQVSLVSTGKKGNRKDLKWGTSADPFNSASLSDLSGKPYSNPRWVSPLFSRHRMADTAYLTVTPQGALMGVCGGWPKYGYSLSKGYSLSRGTAYAGVQPGLPLGTALVWQVTGHAPSP